MNPDNIPPLLEKDVAKQISDFQELLKIRHAAFSCPHREQNSVRLRFLAVIFFGRRFGFFTVFVFENGFVAISEKHRDQISEL